MPSEDIKLVLMVVAGCTIFTIFFIYIWDFVTFCRLRPLIKAFGFQWKKEGKRRSSDTIEGNWNEHHIQIHYQVGSKSKPSSLLVSISSSYINENHILFQRERNVDRLVKNVGLTREFQTGDMEFDRQIFIESDRDDLTPPLLRRTGLRNQILALLTMAPATLSLEEGFIVYRIKAHLGWRKYFKPLFMEKVLFHLVQLEQEVKIALTETTCSSSSTSSPHPVFNTQRSEIISPIGRAIVFIACLFFFLGPISILFGTRYPTLTWQLELWGLGIGAGLMFFYLPIIFASFRGHSKSHRNFSTFMIIGLVGFPSFFVGSLKIINGLFDFRAPVPIQAQVHSRVSKSCRVNVQIHLPELQGGGSVKVSPQQYETLQRGDFIPVLISPGALGQPWIVKAVP